MAIGARVMDKLSRKPHEFLDKTLLDFEQDRVTELSLQTGDETLRLVRDGKGKDWNIKQPIETDADTATVNSLLFDLKDTRIVAYVNEAAKDLEAYGLEPPSRKLTLQAGKELALGFKTGNPTRDEKNLFAVRTGEAMVFILKKEAVDKIFRPLHDLRNKKLLRFSMDKVSKIKINYPETTFVLEKKDGGWSLLKPERLKKIKSFLAKDILWTLNNLEFEERVDPPVAPAESGLDHPAVSITLWEGDHSLGSVRVGAKTGSQYYAQAEGRPGLYKIKDRFLNEIPKDVKRFKDG